jgi:hypothetical protein
MDAASPRGAELPVPPGQSPFQIKGNSYVGALAFYAEHAPGGVGAVLARLAHDPALVAFLRQRFREGALYDVLPMVPLHRAGAETLGRPVAATLEDLSEWQTRRDVNGIYRMLLRLPTPEALMERWARVSSQYFNFVRTEVRRLEPRAYEVSSSGVPEMLLPTYVAVVGAYTRTALLCAGARAPRTVWKAPSADGQLDGVPLVRLAREVRWTAAE